MPKFQFFYDYACPFGKKTYEDLMDILPAYPGLEVEWRPIEAHPQPENYRPHTDLSIQAYYIAEELGADMDTFHRALFHAASVEYRYIDEIEVLAEALKDIINRNKLLETLKNGKYAAKVSENNDLAYEKEGVWYSPALRVIGNEKLRLDAKGGIGINREELREFIETIRVTACQSGDPCSGNSR
jgi:protein-disulfide isomerase